MTSVLQSLDTELHGRPITLNISFTLCFWYLYEPKTMKGENSDYQRSFKTWPSFFVVFSVTVLYVFSVLAGVVLFLQYKDIKELEFRVLSLEKERVLFPGKEFAQKVGQLIWLVIVSSNGNFLLQVSFHLDLTSGLLKLKWVFVRPSIYVFFTIFIFWEKLTALKSSVYIRRNDLIFNNILNAIKSSRWYKIDP